MAFWPQFANPCSRETPQFLPPGFKQTMLGGLISDLQVLLPDDPRDTTPLDPWKDLETGGVWPHRWACWGKGNRWVPAPWPTAQHPETLGGVTMYREM